MHLRLLKHLRLCGREARPTGVLALPIMAGMVAQMLMGLTDAIMVGRVGVVPLAASTLVNAMTQLPLVGGFGLLSSIAVLTSQAFGARRPDEAGEVLRHGLVLSVATGLVAALLPIVCLHPFLSRLGQPPEVAAAAGTYLILFSASLCPALVAHGGKQFSDALKHPWAPTFILLGGVLLNAFLNWILIYGNWGAPAMGLEGAGTATLLARTAVMICMIGYVAFGTRLRAFRPGRWRAAWSGERFKALLHLGWPVGLQHLLEISAFAFAALMMGWISAEAIAAHQIAITCAATTFMFALGIGMATSIRVGHVYGAAQHSRIRRIGFSSAGMAGVLMGVFGLMFLFAGEFIAGLFVRAPAVVELARQLLVVAALFQVADGFQVVFISALRGLNDVRVPALIAMLAYWIVALPLGGLLAFPVRLGAVGMWIGLATGLGLAAIGLCWRFYRATSLRKF